jgi:hypothetical protein
MEMVGIACSRGRLLLLLLLLVLLLLLLEKEMVSEERIG